jgi:hypothetical protein
MSKSIRQGKQQDETVSHLAAPPVAPHGARTGGGEYSRTIMKRIHDKKKEEALVQERALERSKAESSAFRETWKSNVKDKRRRGLQEKVDREIIQKALSSDRGSMTPGGGMDIVSSKDADDAALASLMRDIDLPCEKTGKEILAAGTADTRHHQKPKEEKEEGSAGEAAAVAGSADANNIYNAATGGYNYSRYSGYGDGESKASVADLQTPTAETFLRRALSKSGGASGMLVRIVILLIFLPSFLPSFFSCLWRLCLPLLPILLPACILWHHTTLHESNHHPLPSLNQS